MSTEVLLTADVKDVGSVGDLVRVSEGFARNYLFPKKLAAPVNAGTKRRLAKVQAEREAARARQADEARAVAARVENAKCQIRVKAGKDQKLFGSVTAADIVAALAGQGIALEKDQVVLDAPIKELGVVSVPVNLAGGVTATLKVWVLEE